MKKKAERVEFCKITLRACVSNQTMSRIVSSGLLVIASLLGPNISNAADQPTLSVSAIDTREGENMDVTVMLDAPASDEISVVLFTRDGTARQREDYYGTTQNISIARGQRSVVVPVQILADGEAEGDQYFWLHLINANGAKIRTPRTRAIIYDEDDNRDSFSISDVQVDESSDRAEITIRRDRPSKELVELTLFTREDSANRSTDYFGFSQSISFRPGETSKQATLGIVNDSVPEPDERLKLLLIKDRKIAARAFVIIKDDDEDRGTPLPRLRIESESVLENSGRLRLDARLSEPSSEEVKFTVYTKSVTAIQGVDYYGFTQDVTIPAGWSFTTIFLDIIDDAVIETTEILELRLTGVTGAFADPNAIITIEDNDDENGELPEFRGISLVDSAFENAGVVRIKVAIDKPSDRKISVDLKTVERDRLIPSYDARVPEDYLAVSETLVFNPGETSVEFTVDITDDNIQERDERVYTQLSNPVNAALPSRSRNQSFVIIDNEPPLLPVVNVENAIVDENNGFANFYITQTGYRFDQPSPRVAIDVIEDTAKEGIDYIPIAPTLRAQMSYDEASENVMLGEIIDNSVDSPGVKRIKLVLSEVENGLAGGEGLLFIVDDDGGPAPVIVNVGLQSVLESDPSIKVRVSLMSASTVMVQVTVSTADNTALAGEDYEAVTQTITFYPGEISKYVVVPLYEDNLNEADLERIDILMSNVQGATIGQNGAVFIQDDDL